MFDINAPLERQRTRDGRKVVFLVDSKMGEYPIIFKVGCEGNMGTYVANSCGAHITGREHKEDLQTLPEQIPDVVTFVTQYAHPHSHGSISDSLTSAYVGRLSDCLSIVKLTYNPNTNETYVETVWTKGSEQ